MTIRKKAMTKPVFPQSAMTAFSQLYPETPGLFGHDLIGHPLLEIGALVELGERLNPAHVEYNRAALPIGVDPAAVQSNGLSIADTIRSIEENGSWMVLKWIENDPAYKALLEETLGELRALIEPITGRMMTLEGFIFVSSPEAVTPYHMDPEHNILLQVRGSKTFSVFPQNDHDILSDVEHERYHMGGHRNLPWRDDFALKAKPFQMVPGDAIHVPVKAPHWIKVGPELSVSLSVTWRSEWSYREADARGFNHVLRRMGVSPATTGRFPHQNYAKAIGFRAMRRLGIGS
jgi:Cupin-like domain